MVAHFSFFANRAGMHFGFFSKVYIFENTGMRYYCEACIHAGFPVRVVREVRG